MNLHNFRTAQALVYSSVLLVLSALAAGTWWSLRQAYKAEVADIMQANERTAHKLADRTTEVFDRVNQTTLLVKHLRQTGAPTTLLALRDAGVISGELVQFVSVSDRRGFVIDTTAGLAAANVADEDFFKRHQREADLDVAIAPVWLNPITGEHGIPVTRRLELNGAFDGLTTAIVNPQALSVAYARTEAKGTAVGVLGADGVFRSRALDGKLTFGERADPVRVMQRAAEVRNTGLPIVSPIDGVLRFAAAVKVQKYPLYAVVAVDARVALAAYDKARMQLLGWAAVFGAGTLLSGCVVLAQARRLDASRRRTKRAEAVFRATLEGSMDAVTILVAQRSAEGVLVEMTVSHCNTLAATLVGRTQAQLLGCPLCTAAPSMRAHLPSFDRVIRTQRGDQVQLAATEPHLQGRWLHHQLVPLEDGLALITRDVTDKRLAEETLAAAARCDGLTGLANRRAIDEHLEAARARALRNGAALAVLYLDLDGFKTINDTLGHAAGDAVLIEVARRLRLAVRDTDTVGRMGGDEFVVLAEGAGTVPDVEDLCARVLAALREPHALAGGPALATPSVGVAVFNHHETAQALCQRADAAMYAAKSAGKCRAVVSDFADFVDSADMAAAALPQNPQNPQNPAWLAPTDRPRDQPTPLGRSSVVFDA